MARFLFDESVGIKLAKVLAEKEDVRSVIDIMPERT